MSLSLFLIFQIIAIAPIILQIIKGDQQWMFNIALFGLKILMGHVQSLMEKHLGPMGRAPFQDDIAVAF